MQEKIKTIVAGTTFGQFYMKALEYMSDRFEFCGILAGGSKRSERLAKEYQVPLYKNVDDLPEDIELACVIIRASALGGKGTELSLALMNRGISIIQEQPLHHKELSECFRCAKKNGVFFHVGDLYVNLPAVRQFTAAAKELMKKQQIVYIEVSCSTQVSYPLVDILCHIFPTMRPFRIKKSDNESGPFHILTAEITKIPTIFLIHNEMNPDDPDNFMHLLQRITVGTTAGRLCLYDSHGGVTWHNRLHVPTSLYSEGALNQKLPDNLYQNSRYQLGDLPEMRYSDIIGIEWPKSIARDLDIYCQLKEGKLKRPVLASRELIASEIWHSITNELGYATLQYSLEYESITVADLNERALSEVGCPWIDKEKPLERQQVDTFMEKLNMACANAMLGCLRRNGCLVIGAEGQTLVDIMKTARIKPDFEYIIERWLMFLESIGYVQQRNGKYFALRSVTDEETEISWAIVQRKWNRHFGSSLVMEYLIENVKHLEELIRGDVNATNLLFLGGKMDHANALYAETAITEYLNSKIAELVENLVKDGAKILEIGAGTGSTTRKVVAALEEFGAKDVSYCFSDVSDYFLDEARIYYRRYGFMNEYRIFDINKPAEGQGIEDESRDIIIAAGVLNNAVDTEISLKNILRLLKRGGTLIISEPTGEFAEILISQAFMIMKPIDQRSQSKTTFLTDNQWRDTITRQGIESILVFPQRGHAFENLRQRLYVIKK